MTFWGFKENIVLNVSSLQNTFHMHSSTCRKVTAGAPSSSCFTSRK